MTRAGANAVFTCLLLLVASAIGVDAYRIGFFADDFHFLDVARRLPLSATLLGQDGIWPWFRPLSRELYFKLIVATGPMSIVAAHTLNLACVFACAWLLWRIAYHLFAAQVAAVATALFVSYDLTKFLTAWASGMQDLLALLLALLALDAYLRGRHSQAPVWAFLAPFAKETGFLVFPLLMACWYFLSDRRPSAAWLTRLAAVGGLAILVHILARLSWESGGAIPRSELAPEQLPSVLGQMLGAFLGSGPAVGPPWLAIVAGFAAAALLTFASSRMLEPIHPATTPSLDRGIYFASTAALMGIAPVVAGHLLNLTTAHAYQMFPASPWIAVLLGRLVVVLPVRVWRTAISALGRVERLVIRVQPSQSRGPRHLAFHSLELARGGAVQRRFGSTPRRCPRATRHSSREPGRALRGNAALLLLPNGRWPGVTRGSSRPQRSHLLDQRSAARRCVEPARDPVV